MMNEKFNCSRSISLLHMSAPYLFLISKFTFPPEHLSGKFVVMLIWTADLIIISYSTSINLTSFLFLLKKRSPELAFSYDLFSHVAVLYMGVLLNQFLKYWFSSSPGLHPCCLCFTPVDSSVNLLLGAEVCHVASSPFYSQLPF